MWDSPVDPLFTDDETAQLIEMGHRLRRPVGHTFFTEGEESDYVLLIQRGHVQVMVGKPRRIIAFRGPGELLGEMAALRQHPRTAAVVAVTDVEVVIIAAQQWLEFMDANPRAMIRLVAVLNQRLDAAAAKIVDADLTAERRLAKALIEVTDAGIGDNIAGGVMVRFSQQDLSSLTGVSIESIKKIVRNFKQHAIIETGRRSITIRDTVALKDIVRGNRTTSPT